MHYLEAQIQRTDVLAAAIAVVTGTHSLDEVFQTVVNHVARLLEAERVIIFLFGEEENALIHPPRPRWALAGTPSANCACNPAKACRATSLPPANPISPTATTTSYKTTCNTVTRKLYEEALESPQRAWSGGATVPLHLNDRIIGTLSVSGSQRPFGDDDMKFLERMADQTTLTIDRTQRTEDLQRRNAELEEKDRFLHALQEIGETTLSSLYLNKILDNLYYNIVAAGIFETLMIALVDHQRHQVEVVRNHRYRMQDGRPVEKLGGGEVGIKYDLDDTNITAEVARSGNMRVIEEWDERFDKRIDNPAARRGRISYFIPVKREDRFWRCWPRAAYWSAKRNS